MSDFEDNVLRGFEQGLNIYRTSKAGSCIMRLPVNRDGTDADGAREYDCIPSPSPDALTLAAGGFIPDYQFSITVRKDDFETLPISGDLFVKSGRVTRILSLETTDISPVVLLHCGTPDK